MAIKTLFFVGKQEQWKVMHPLGHLFSIHGKMGNSTPRKYSSLPRFPKGPQELENNEKDGNQFQVCSFVSFVPAQQKGFVFRRMNEFLLPKEIFLSFFQNCSAATAAEKSIIYVVVLLQAFKIV